MAYGFRKKDAVELAWIDNRDQIKLDIRSLVRRLENDLLDTALDEFQAAANRGELLRLRQPEAAIADLMKQHAARLALEYADEAQDNSAPASA